MTSLPCVLLLATVTGLAAVSCDLPVQTIDKGVVEQRPSRKDEHWAFAYGFSAREWRDMVNGSQLAAEYLRLLLEKGQQDWDDELLEGGVLDLRRHLLRSPKRLQAVRHVVTLVLRNQRLGEMFGNRKMLEATSSYFLLGFDASYEELPKTLEEDLQSLRGLDQAFRLFSGSRYKACLRSRLTPDTAKELCRKCLEFWSCAEGEAPALVRVTLEAPRIRDPKTDDLSHLGQLPRVKILEMGSGKIFRKDLMHELLKMFPNVRVLKLNMAPNEVLAYPHVHGWASSILALDIHAPMTSSVVQMICQLHSLRYLTFGGVEASTFRVNLKAFPECIGNLSQLLHLKVVGCNLTGSDSMPFSLAHLKDLRIFEAFEQGRLNTADESACPGPWVPNRSHCVPGYVARADPPPAGGPAPVWRCPVHGWNVRMDDMTLPWWGWKAIEKMHIDANFIYGTIPETLPQLWPRLRSLDLHDLKLTGTLPLALTALENLTQLQVQLNDLHCEASGPDVVARLAQRPKMRVLHVDANPRMCGCLPSLAPSFLHLQVGESSVRLGCDDHQEL